MTVTSATYVPDVHFTRPDGVECCVHTIPVAPGSCDACWDLAKWDVAPAPAAAEAAPALLPQRSPALTLHQAAAKLRRAASVAAVVRQAEDGRTDADWASDMDNALGGPIGEFCGLFTPQLALDLADHLDTLATQAVRNSNQQDIAGGWAIRTAKHILGEVS